MNGILGMTALALQKSPLEPEQREYMETVRKLGGSAAGVA